MPASNILTGNSPAATASQILHCGTGSLAGEGFVVRLGDGTATPLTISSAGISTTNVVATTSLTTPLLSATTSLTTPLAKIGTGSAITNLTSAATVGRTITLADADGMIYPVVAKRVTSDVINTTTTFSELSALNFTPVAGKTYLVELYLICSTAATTTGICFYAEGHANSGLVLWDTNTNMGFTATNQSYVPANTPAGLTAGGAFAIVFKGTFTAYDTQPLKFFVRSEVAGSQVKVFASSYLTLTAID
jgi:hypothetical protein